MRIPWHEDKGALWQGWAVVRTALCWAALVIVTVAVCLIYLVVAPVAPDSRLLKWLERTWGVILLRASNVKLTASGLEHVERGRSYIVMANHRSMYDVPVLLYLLAADRDLRWVGKAEITKVPFFGWAFAMSRHVPIRRERREAAIAALKAAAAASAEGVSFVIMPEGTRSRDARLRPFKKGGFHLALDTVLPILPVAIVGAQRLMPKGTWWILPGAIHAEVKPAVETAGFGRDAIEELSDRVRAEIRSALPDEPPDHPAPGGAGRSEA